MITIEELGLLEEKCNEDIYHAKELIRRIKKLNKKHPDLMRILNDTTGNYDSHDKSVFIKNKLSCKDRKILLELQPWLPVDTQSDILRSFHEAGFECKKFEEVFFRDYYTPDDEGFFDVTEQEKGDE